MNQKKILKFQLQHMKTELYKAKKANKIEKIKKEISNKDIINGYDYMVISNKIINDHRIKSRTKVIKLMYK